MKPLRQYAQEMGLRGVLVTGLGCVLLAAALLALYRLSGEPAGNAPLTDGDSVTKVVPASGPEGFPVEAFCKDAATEVEALYAPDGAAGVYYQVTRIKDGVAEAVVWTPGPDGDNATATHYWFNDDGVQQAGPAVVSGKARECIEGKSK